jgi:hypothetical protein
VAWGLTAASLGLPVLAGMGAVLGITNRGDEIHVAWFTVMFGSLVAGLVLSVVVHFWGLARAFYPAISRAWVAICILGIVAGCLTLAAAVFAWLRMFAMA